MSQPGSAYPLLSPRLQFLRHGMVTGPQEEGHSSASLPATAQRGPLLEAGTGSVSVPSAPSIQGTPNP